MDRNMIGVTGIKDYKSRTSQRTSNDAGCTTLSRLCTKLKARELSKRLLDDVCTREALLVNQTFAACVEPLISEERTRLKLPKFSSKDNGRSPHYFLPTVGQNMSFKGSIPFHDLPNFEECFVPTSVDITEPPFDECSELWLDKQMSATSNNKLDSIGDRNYFSSIERIGSFHLNLSRNSSRNSFNFSNLKDEFMSISNDSKKSNYYHGSNKSCSKKKSNEPSAAPDSGFHLFKFQLSHLLRVPDSKILKAVEGSWLRLPEYEKSAFEMQRLILRDNYKIDMVNFMSSLNESDKCLYVNDNRNALLQLFDYDTDHEIFQMNPKDMFWDCSYDSNSTNTRKGCQNSDSTCQSLSGYDSALSSCYSDEWSDHAKDLKAFPWNTQSKECTDFQSSDTVSPFCSTSKISWNFDYEYLGNCHLYGDGKIYSHATISSITSDSMFSEINSCNNENANDVLIDENYEDKDIDSDSTLDESNSSIVSIIRRPSLC